MNSLFPTFLTLHLTALTVMAGTTLVDFMAYRSLWKTVTHEKELSTGLLQLMAKLPRIIGIGAAVLISTGMGMMILTHGVFGEQLWFRIKFGLVVLLILNGLLVGRRLGLKLRRLLADNGPVLTDQVNVIRGGLTRFHLLQLSIFFIIIFLSAFKFN
nr:hypothetical protein [uncultured Mucilaginibacter sp.]